MKYVLFLMISVLPMLQFAQSTVLQSAEEETVADSRVLVIPFHPTRYYFSDCDKSIAAESRLKMPHVRRSFMYGFDYATESRFEKRYEPMNLLQMKDSVDVDYFQAFYDNVTYAYETPTRLKSKVEKKFFQKVRGKFEQIGQKEETPVTNDNESYINISSHEEKYMALNWKDNAYLSDLVTTYDPNYIVTINQFEIKTDYNKCIDRELGNYTRRIRVHYNVFTPEGRLLTGDVLTARYNSTTDDINKIIQDNFGMLAEYIMKALPKS